MPTSPANEAADGADPQVNTDTVTEPAEAADPTTGDQPDGDEVARLTEELARVRDRYRRALADLDNYRKRTERDQDRRATEARNRQLTEWLDALDSVERGLQSEPDDPGLTAVLQQMESILERNGVHRLANAGDLFDPVRHEAIAVQPSAEMPDRTILEVARSGFGTADGEVLRSAQVVVSRRPVDEA